ncbi:MAG: hypothetical protein Q3X12_02160 [Hallella sp.]|nr:hypothetical protein [Hallella sp.]
MDELFSLFIQRISERMPELTLVDEDYGQLEAGLEEETYPVTFPCVLIGNLEADWENLTGGGQRGTVFFSVRLAVDCYDDTHYGSGTESKVAERLLMANRVYAALQGFRPNNSMTALVRTKSRFYSLPACIKAYEYTFSFRIHDDSTRELQRRE